MKNFKKYFSHVIVLLVIFSMILPNYSWAKRQKPGAHVVVTKTDGTVVAGELLMVKDKSLLLMASSGISGEEIKVNEILIVSVKIKGKFLKNVLKGTLFFASLGGIMGAATGWEWGATGSDWWSWPIAFGGGLGILGMTMGAFSGLVSRSRKDIYFKEKTPRKVKSILKKLKKYARVKN